MGVQVSIFFFSVCTMLFCLDMLTDFMHLGFNHGLVFLVAHSVLATGLCVILLLRSYRSDICCQSERGSVWMVYGCSCWSDHGVEYVDFYRPMYESTETMFTFCNLPSSHPTPTTNSSIQTTTK